MTGFLKGKIIKIEILSFLPSSLPFTQLGSQRRDEWGEEGGRVKWIISFGRVSGPPIVGSLHLRIWFTFCRPWPRSSRLVPFRLSLGTLPTVGWKEWTKGTTEAERRERQTEGSIHSHSSRSILRTEREVRERGEWDRALRHHFLGLSGRTSRSLWMKERSGNRDHSLGTSEGLTATLYGPLGHLRLPRPLRGAYHLPLSSTRGLRPWSQPWGDKGPTRSPR